VSRSHNKLHSLAPPSRLQKCTLPPEEEKKLLDELVVIAEAQVLHKLTSLRAGLGGPT
jgi:hypothetical protein